MRTSVTSCLLVTWLLGVAIARADDPKLPDLQISPAIAARMHWIQQRMITGRVVAASGVSVPRTFVQTPGRQTGRRESLSLEITAGTCRLQYESVSNEDRVKLWQDGNETLSIRRDCPAARYVLEFQQRPNQPLSLVLEQGDAKRSWRAEGFWQLYLAEPEVVRKHLVPLLETLRTSWQLGSTAAEIEESLFRAARSSSRPASDRRRWSELVDALGSPNFSERENAQRELQRTGQIAVPFLQSLDRTRLDAEQAYRVRSLIESLSADDEDTTERVASWLVDDPRVWLSLLTRTDAAKRRTAAAELARLTGGPIDFDPDASDQARGEQLERLRARLEAAKDTAPVTD